MKRLRTVSILLLCLIVPIQSYAALGIAAGECPMTSMDGAGDHSKASHDSSGMMLCCHEDGGNISGKGCDTCANCTLCAGFLTIAAGSSYTDYSLLPDTPRHEASAASLNLFAIWRPPTLH